MSEGGVTTTAVAVSADPRPVFEQGCNGPTVVGVRCRGCDHPCAARVPRCPRCGAATEVARFGPEGAVWATTTIHVAAGQRAAPYTVAYVDLDEGPRILADVDDGPELVPRVTERVRLVGRTALGDLRVEVRR